MQMDCSKEAPVYAGFWVRLAAFGIDHLVMLVPLLIVTGAVSGFVSMFDGTFLAGNVLFQYTLTDIIAYLFQVMYFVVSTYMTGTTLGKKLLNLRVISVNEEENLTVTDVLFRETIGRFLCSISMSIGYILIGLDSQKRGFHDMLSDTRVIYAKKVKVYPVYQENATTSQAQSVAPEKDASEAGNAYGYVPVQITPEHPSGESKDQVTGGTYFYVSEENSSQEEKSSENEE